MRDVVEYRVLLDNYLAVFLGTIIGVILVLTALIGSRILAPYKREPMKGTPYECGMLPIGRAQTLQIHFRYYFFAILFIIFDVEAVFLFPWAVTFLGVGQAAFYSMVLFIIILALGLAYAWKKGVLQWR
jgi:NADH:ubiquinone oxidoreductase subunit 3 (subunit A)